MLSEATWWGAAGSGSAEVRPSASLERNEGGARTLARTDTPAPHYTGKELLLTEQQQEQDSCVHQITQVNASLTYTNTLKCDKSKLDIKPK